jgi:hypothetical protein
VLALKMGGSQGMNTANPYAPPRATVQDIADPTTIVIKA